jgi:catechol 2,3-dioxygenase-like lactoylglutathione lyase family enzyme
MRPSILVVTLAVADLERALAFYRDGLGLATSGIIATELHDEVSGAAGAIAIFKLDGGLILSLYPRTDLAKDAGIAVDATSRTEFSLGHTVASREEVDAVLARARAAGARLTGGPRDRPWGIYSGYFEDPDGHLWEVIWNPDVADDGAT